MGPAPLLTTLINNFLQGALVNKTELIEHIAKNADISKAREKLGYSPRIKIEVGIPLFVDWFRRNIA